MPAGRHKKGDVVSSKSNKKVFVNRTKARDAFKREYEKIKNSNMSEWSMLYFHGVGGIGKSELLRRFKMDNGLTDAEIAKSGKYCLTYDFQNGSLSTLDIIVNWRNILAGNYPKKFKFRDFDIAMLIYYEKNGMSSEIREVAQSWVESPLFGAFEDANDIINGNQDLIEALSAIPGVNAALKGFKLVTHLSNIAQNQIEKKRIENIKSAMSEEMNYKETVEVIVDYFATNLAECSEELDEPLVMIIDTYENYVNRYSTSYNVYIDEWLYKQVISYASGILWVIAGREELLWPWEDMGFEEKPKDLLFELKELDDDYVYEYLTDMEVDEKYHQAIKDNSKGNPLWMQLSAEGCLKAQELGQEFDFTNITTSEVLVERYLRYMDDARADFIKQLALIGSWMDEDMLSTLIRGYNATTYERIKEACFVRSEGDAYYMHILMREVVCSICHKKEYSEIKHLNERIWQYGMTGFDEEGKLVCEDETLELEEKKQRLIFMLKYGTYNAVDTWDQDIICNAADEFWEINRTRDFLDVADEVREYKASIQGEEDEDTVGYGLMVAYVKSEAGIYDEALALYNKLLEIQEKFLELDEDDISILTTKTGITECLVGLKKYHEAETLGESVVEALMKHDEAYDEDILRAMIALVSCKFALNNKEGIDLGERALGIARSSLGEENNYTITLRGNLSSYYLLCGMLEKAKTHLKETLDIYKKLFGEDHGITETAAVTYATVLRTLGEYEEAEKIDGNINDEIDIDKAEYIDEDGNLNMKTIAKSNSLMASGKFQEALEMYSRMVVEMEKESCLDVSQFINTIKLSMLICFSELERYEEGEAIGQEILEELAEMFTEESMSTLRCMEILAGCKVKLCKYLEAAVLYNRLADGLGKAAGEITEGVIRNRYNSAYYGYVMRGRYEEALKKIEAIIPYYEQIIGVDDQATIGVKSVAVQLCRILGEYDKGLSLGSETVRIWMNGQEKKTIDNEDINIIIQQMNIMVNKKKEMDEQ